MEPLRILLPFPPSANRYWRSVPNRKRGAPPQVLVSDLGEAYKRAVAAICSGVVRPPWEGPVLLTVTAQHTDPRWDANNLPKVLCDALEGFAFANDRQARRMVVHLHIVPDVEPRLLVEVEPLPIYRPPDLHLLQPPDAVRWRLAMGHMEAAREKVNARERRKRKAKREGKADSSLTSPADLLLEMVKATARRSALVLGVDHAAPGADRTARSMVDLRALATPNVRRPTVHTAAACDDPTCRAHWKG